MLLLLFAAVSIGIGMCILGFQWKDPGQISFHAHLRQHGLDPDKGQLVCCSSALSHSHAHSHQRVSAPTHSCGNNEKMKDI